MTKAVALGDMLREFSGSSRGYGIARKKRGREGGDDV